MQPIPHAGTAPATPAPRSVLGWLPVLWTRVLFPGTTSGPDRVRPAALVLLLILPGALLYPCMSFYLFEPDEGRYAEIPRAMLARGEGIVPYLQGKPYLDKPPLLYWLVMGSYTLFGTHAWAARLVPAAAVHATILLLYLLGRRSVGERSAFWGALLLTLSPLFAGVGRLLLLDGLLALWVTAALFAAFEATRGAGLRRGWWLLSACACGLGVLTKGPVILVLVLAPLWLHRRLTGATWRVGWQDRATWAGVVLAVALPWYVAVCVRVPEFAYHFLWEHNVVRFMAPFDHLEPVWFYVPLLLVGLLPGTLLLVPFLRFLGSGDPAVAARRPRALGFLLLAGLGCFAFFSLSGCKLPTYILPAFPPLALALGHFVAHHRWPRRRLLTAAVATGLVLQATGHYLFVPWYADYRSPLAQWGELSRACADPDTPVICYPRSAHAISFYLAREDMPNYRSKEVRALCVRLKASPRTVVLLTHRHSLRGLAQALPPELRVVETTHFGLARPDWLSERTGRAVVRALGETALGLCDLAVVERRGGATYPLPVSGQGGGFSPQIRRALK